MDAQRKKGILDVCVLAVLKKGPSYGYKIIRDISRCIDISESTLYPILKRLEQNGSLKTYRREYNGRIRKYYELTETGQNRINVFLEEWDELRTMYLFIEEENRQGEEEAFCDTSASENEAPKAVPSAEQEQPFQEESQKERTEAEPEGKTEEQTEERAGEEAEEKAEERAGTEERTEENAAEAQPEKEEPDETGEDGTDGGWKVQEEVQR